LHLFLESLEEEQTLPNVSVTQKKVQSKESALSCRFQEASVPTKHTQKHTQKEKKKREKDAS